MKLLIANRGEIAARVIRTAREMGIRTVAVYSDPDRRALHAEQADEAVAIGGIAPAESYLDQDRILDAARRTGADAVHPGYGFLAEHAGFARACANTGLTFVGPPPVVIAAMADKMRARHLMQDAGLPVLPGGTDPARVGFPLIVKAACGGGGKGIRVVHNPEDLDHEAAAARREAAAAFGDHRVFFEQYLHPARHVEVQVFGDTRGRVLHLGERECSIQRRHQKVIEETPSPAVDAELRTALGAAAVTAAKALGYVNAGTVEFLLGPSGAFYFLEMNTRLQVEHPVTEMAWRHRGAFGDEPLDLVQLQLLVALGEPLPLAQDDVVPAGHAIEARVYAEDTSEGFAPSTGRLDVWEPATGVRVDSAARAGDEVTTHYDSLLAKIIAAGPTRKEAAARLARALRSSRIHGVTTNRDLLVRTLESPAFLAGDLSTTFLADHELTGTVTEPDALHLAAAALTSAHGRAPAQPVAYDRAVVTCEPGQDGRWAVRIGDTEHHARVYAWPDERPDRAIDLELDAHRTHATVTRIDGRVYVDSPLGHLALKE
ncbi:MAG: acetyl-CoA carboxylase biotin carboxylase subunit [Egibacteraceae bacterium]